MNYSVVADRFMRDLIQDFLGGTDLNRVRAQFGGRLVALLREAQKDAETDARMIKPALPSVMGKGK